MNDKALTQREFQKFRKALGGKGCFNCLKFKRCRREGVFDKKLLEEIWKYPRAQLIGCGCPYWE